MTFPCGGPLADHYTTIEADSELEARLELQKVYTPKGWAGIYGTSRATVLRHDLTYVPFGAFADIASDYTP